MAQALLLLRGKQPVRHDGNGLHVHLRSVPLSTMVPENTLKAGAGKKKSLQDLSHEVKMAQYLCVCVCVYRRPAACQSVAAWAAIQQLSNLHLAQHEWAWSSGS